MRAFRAHRVWSREGSEDSSSKAVRAMRAPSSASGFVDGSATVQGSLRAVHSDCCLGSLGAPLAMTSWLVSCPHSSGPGFQTQIPTCLGSAWGATYLRRKLLLAPFSRGHAQQVHPAVHLL